MSKVMNTIGRPFLSKIARAYACGLSAPRSDVVWDVSRRTFDPGVYHGHEELTDFFARLLEVWESGRIEPTDFMASDDEVVVAVRLHLVSRTHGKTMTADAAHVWTLRDGKIIRHCSFQTKADALAAVGLPG